jgi:hypothetical protein
MRKKRNPARQLGTGGGAGSSDLAGRGSVPNHLSAKAQHKPSVTAAFLPGLPIIIGMRRWPLAPADPEGVTWWITLFGGGTVELTTAELTSRGHFRRAWYQQLGGRLCPMPRGWLGVLGRAMHKFLEAPSRVTAASPPGPPNIIGVSMSPRNPVGSEEVTWWITLAGGGTVLLTTAELHTTGAFAGRAQSSSTLSFARWR